MKTDSILAEIWRIKEEIAAEHGYDVRKIAAAAIESQKQHGDRLVDRSTKKAGQVADAKRDQRP